MLYYADDSISIHHADFRDVLPTIASGSIALVVADPPYGVGETGKISKPATGQAYGGRSNTPKLEKNRRATFVPSMVWTGDDYDAEPWDAERLDALRSAGPCIIWGGNYYADRLPASPCWLVWDKDNGGTDFADVELAWCSHPTAARLFRFRWNGMLQGDMANREPRIYPGQKPVPLMRWVVSMYSKPGDLIFDPCCGSGPVARAAKEMGRRVIACDLSERACELAAKRCRQEVLSL